MGNGEGAQIHDLMIEEGAVLQDAPKLDEAASVSEVAVEYCLPMAKLLNVESMTFRNESARTKTKLEVSDGGFVTENGDPYAADTLPAATSVTCEFGIVDGLYNSTASTGALIELMDEFNMSEFSIQTDEGDTLRGSVGSKPEGRTLYIAPQAKQSGGEWLEDEPLSIEIYGQGNIRLHG